MGTGETQVLNLVEALDRVEGDVDLLKEMVNIFLEECPRMLADIERAITASDSHALHDAAHTLKGSVCNFGAPRATTASLALEKMGRQQDLAQAAAAFTTLKNEMALLGPALAVWKEKEAA